MDAFIANFAAWGSFLDKILANVSSNDFQCLVAPCNGSGNNVRLLSVPLESCRLIEIKGCVWNKLKRLKKTLQYALLALLSRVYSTSHWTERRTSDIGARFRESTC